MNKGPRLLLAFLMVFGTFSGSVAVNAAYTDLGKYTQDLRLAKNEKNTKRRLEIHYQFLRDTYAKALAETTTS